MRFIFNAPINSLSFGNVSLNLLREFWKAGDDVILYPIGDQVDISAFDKLPDAFKAWLQECINSRYAKLSKDIPTLKLWHLNGSESRLSEKQLLYTFHELDSLTKEEISLANHQNKVVVSSSYSTSIFKSNGVSNVANIGLGFDTDFNRGPSDYFPEKIHFGLMGKFEKRKHTAKLISAWIEKYGNDNRYMLTCAIVNPFLPEEKLKNDILSIFNGRRINNINFVPRVTTNTEVNDYLNAIDIDLGGMSGAEGWNLPSFNATALGKWSIVLNATSHKDWANDKNSILVEPNGKISAEDGRFFVKGQPFNQGSIYDFSKDDLNKAFEVAVSKAKTLNTDGLRLQSSHSYGLMAEKLKMELAKL